MPAILTSRPQTGLSFLAPEPEDIEDLYSRYKVHLCLVTNSAAYQKKMRCVSFGMTFTEFFTCCKYGLGQANASLPS